jgi:hypothetical protein
MSVPYTQKIQIQSTTMNDLLQYPGLVENIFELMLLVSENQFHSSVAHTAKYLTSSRI